MHKNTKIVLLGLGKVGRELVRQVNASGRDFAFTALADSSAFVGGAPLTAEQMETALEIKDNGGSLTDLAAAQPLAQLAQHYQPGTLLVDCSAARSLALDAALRSGVKLVFANKNTLSAPWQAAAAFFNNDQVAYEATVGAGLPVIQTLRTLVNTGDSVLHIQGVMSGTLGFLCSQLEQGATYSQAVQQAFEAGYTEPDPRDDLSGFDVLRKALILARSAGWPLEKEHFTVEALYDESLANLPVAHFFAKMHTLDAAFAQRVAAAQAQGKVLRYLAHITPQGGSVGLQAVAKESALGALQGPGNFIAFSTQRYTPIPLVISGPGAGVAVTAAGVFADILNLSQA